MLVEHHGREDRHAGSWSLTSLGPLTYLRMNPHNIPIFIPNLYKFNLFMIHKCSKLIIISKNGGKASASSPRRQIFGGA